MDTLSPGSTFLIIPLFCFVYDALGWIREFKSKHVWACLEIISTNHLPQNLQYIYMHFTEGEIKVLRS